MTRRRPQSVRALRAELRQARAAIDSLCARLADSTDRLALTLLALGNVRRDVGAAYANPDPSTRCTLLAAAGVLMREDQFLAAWRIARASREQTESDLLLTPERRVAGGAAKGAAARPRSPRTSKTEVCVRRSETAAAHAMTSARPAGTAGVHQTRNHRRAGHGISRRSV